ncbi:HAD family hydrolase [uncultured Psychrobacter sp.]|uniref:HAD family hydrolase n=1 Tax=uncultured Psychrobacter sp. TaxID=259303 RepID=UPI0026085558|nr:HAD family hydrolase [uncultured Psychrobacter sp.]
MIINSKVIVLDLDDTLYSEMSYLKSAYKTIAQNISDDENVLYELMLSKYDNNENVFDFLVHTYSTSKKYLFELYRFHKPTIELYSGVLEFLDYYSSDSEIALVTDGRSKTQRNKIKALGIAEYFDNIVISEEIGSEKPNKDNFEQAILNTKGTCYFYIGDNISKDFVTPNKMGWTTICLKDQGQNIHKQNYTSPNEYHPNHCFESWSEIKYFFDNL